MGDEVFWRSNRLVDTESRSKTLEVEFIPLAFRGSFLSQVLEESEHPITDEHMLIHAAVMRLAKFFHDAIADMGFTSTYARPIISTDTEETIREMKKYSQETDEADFHVEIRYVEKGFFMLAEVDLVKAFSESGLERKMGLELVRNAIPFIVQYEVKEDFPSESGETIAKPEFIILDPFGPIAIYCDSRKYHDKKKGQIFRDRRIDRKLQKLGFVVFRFSEKEINNNLEACIEEIKAKYLGDQYALKLPDVYIKRLRSIAPDSMSIWENRFIETIVFKMKQGMKISQKEESIIHTILKKDGE